MAQLQNWCKGEGINPTYAILIKDVPVDANIDSVEETLQSIKALGQVRVRGRMYDPQSQSLTVLCECREEINTKVIPLEVFPEGHDSPWMILGPSEEENIVKTKQMRDDAQELPQVSGLSFPLQASTPEAMIRVVGDIMQRTGKPASDNNSFRRLRVFSGVVPMPSGEEQLDSWIEQAQLMIEECD